MNRKDTILVFIEGGIVQKVRSLTPKNIVVIDYDCNGIDELSRIKDKNNQDCFLYEITNSTPKKEDIGETIQYYLNLLDC